MIFADAFDLLAHSESIDCSYAGIAIYSGLAGNRGPRAHARGGVVISQPALEGAPQYDGVSLGPNDKLIFASEANWIHVSVY